MKSQNEQTVEDIDGNVYHTITIGTQVWMVENLKVTRYRNGDPIQYIKDRNFWGWNWDMRGAYCDFENISSNGEIYGRLYNWYAINTELLCPPGWHVPSDAEWATLTDYLGGENIAGGKLKDTDTNQWHSPNEGATNESGFTALAGCHRNDKGSYIGLIGLYGQWWSSTGLEFGEAWSRKMAYRNSMLKRHCPNKKFGCSVRCIKNSKLVGNPILIQKPIIEWINIPAGTFTMGSLTNEAYRDENETQHEVTMSAFKMSKFEITFEQFDLFCDSIGKGKPNDAGWGRGENPVVNVSYYDAQAFAEWLDCRLPTEAEWEYACRAGTTSKFFTGEKIDISQANFGRNSHSLEKILPVGSFAPNAWELYDMCGNVWEWCSDWYGDYTSETQINPNGSKIGMERVRRGGSWYHGELSCRSANRNRWVSDCRSSEIGFRLVSSMDV